ncbi:putative light-harvesting complex-like protein OHP2 [Helianthus annuus]|nr:putative light-harvesting complex-like protein OHP2 [Helianthus annuus]
MKKKKKGDSQSRSPVGRKKVQWVDNLGEQLVDIREFESSETGDADNEDDNNACFCAIL